MTKKINILHVDDSRTVVSYTKIMLAGIFTIKMIETAGTVARAKQLMRSKTIDVAILDINMPDGNGIELLEWIKKNYIETTVIMFTNNSDSFFRNAAKKSGTDYFIDKSTEFEDIIEILNPCNSIIPA